MIPTIWVKEAEVPPGTKILKNIYVFKKTTDSEGNLKRFEVRLVVRRDL